MSLNKTEIEWKNILEHSITKNSATEMLENNQYSTKTPNGADENQDTVDKSYINESSHNSKQYFKD